MMHTPQAEHEGLAAAARAVIDEHSAQYRPLGGYALLTVAFNALFVAFLLATGRRERLPARYDLRDLVLLAAATYKSSRLLAKDRVTSFLRAPFTRFTGDTGHGEVEEEARGRGVQRAMGELLICEYCLA